MPSLPRTLPLLGDEESFSEAETGSKKKNNLAAKGFTTVGCTLEMRHTGWAHLQGKGLQSESGSDTHGTFQRTAVEG